MGGDGRRGLVWGRPRKVRLRLYVEVQHGDGELGSGRQTSIIRVLAQYMA